MQKITPFLWFNGNAEEAMNYYVSIFKNSKVVSVNRAGAEGPVMSVTFQLDDLVVPGEVSIQLNDRFLGKCNSRSNCEDWTRCCHRVPI